MLSEALRLIRVYSDFNQTEMAGALGISKSYLSEIEAGKKIATLALLEKYAEVLDVPVSSLLFFSEQLASESRSQGLRIRVAEKVLKLLDALGPRDPELRNASAQSQTPPS